MNFQHQVTKFFPGLHHPRSPLSIPLRTPALPLWSFTIWILGSSSAQAGGTTSVPLNPSPLAISTAQTHSPASTPEINIQPKTSFSIYHSPALEQSSKLPFDAPDDLEHASVDIADQSSAIESKSPDLATVELKAAIAPAALIEGEGEATNRIAATGPENFNPGLRLPPPPPPPLPSPPPAPEPATIPEAAPATVPREANPLKLENLQVDFRNNQEQSGQHNQWIEPTFQFQLGSKGDRLLVTTGFNTFEEPEIETVTNIPLKIGWQTKVGKSTLQMAAGADFFNRLPAALNLDVQASVPLTPSLTLTGVLEQGPYKANARTLENQITAWRFGPNLYWQIDRKTSFFSFFRVGLYNDGNSETQSFSRLERKFGQFHAAANLFTWNARKDMQAESGYFSPPNFLVYNGEIGWQGQPFDFLRCRLTANLGGQRLKETASDGYSYQGLCTADLSRSIELDLGYSVSNILTREAGEGGSQSNALISQLRVKF